MGFPLNTVAKPQKGEMMERPKCPSCGKPMIFSFCIMYNEYVCIPCGRAVEMFNGLYKIKTTQKKEDQLKENYSDDITLLAFTRGGARCKDCNKYMGNNCPTCKLPKELKYWQKGVVDTVHKND